MTDVSNVIVTAATVVDMSDLAIVPIRTRYTYKEIEKNFQYSYNTDETNNSTICDIIAMYIKGQ